MVNRIYYLLTLCIIFSTAAISAAAPYSSGLIFVEGGSYNKAYPSREFINENASFPVFMKSFSAEYKTCDEEGFVTGFGLAGSDIPSGRGWNFDRYEYQPKSFALLPYSFIGYDFKLAGIELGSGALFYFRDSDPVEYLNPDGTTGVLRESGIYLDRERSRAFPNLMFRLLPEKLIHFKIRLGRESFSPIDSLFNMAFIIPYKNSRFELYSSVRTYFDFLPVNNQKFGLTYSRISGPITYGGTISYLIDNEHGGGREDIGIIDYRNLSAGLLLGFRVN